MITLNLSLAEVNTVLQALGAAPYAQVMTVVDTIRTQATPQVQKQQEEASVADLEKAVSETVSETVSESVAEPISSM